MAIYALEGLVAESGHVPPGHIAVGIPARPRPCPELSIWITEAVGLYSDLAERYRTGLRRID